MNVSQEYVNGIKDGREYFKRFAPSESEIKDIIANIRATMKEFSSGPVKDMFKGERDFWSLQLKKINGVNHNGQLERNDSESRTRRYNN